MFRTSDVLRFADRWFDRAHPDSIDRQSRLISCIVLVSIFHLIMSIAFVKMEEWEQKHLKRRASELDISFCSAVIVPMQEPKKDKELLPSSQVLIPFQNGNTGSESGLMAGSKTSSAQIRSQTDNYNKSEKLQLPVQALSRKLETQIASEQASAKRVAANKDEPVLASVSSSTVTESHSDNAQRGDEEGVENAEADDGTGTGMGEQGEIAGNYGVDNAPPGKTTEEMKTMLADISPYRKELLMRIAQKWTAPNKTAVRMLVWLTIDREGNLLRAEILESSGKARVDRMTLDTLQNVEYAPLPDWCKREHLSFKIELRNFQ